MSVVDLTGRRLQARLARAQVAGRIPSVVAGVVRDGVLAWNGSHGSAGLAVPPGPHVQYRIGSVTKTMTAVLVLQLRDEGRLSLSDPLAAHVPDAGFGDRSLRSLLSHTAGLPSEPTGPWWERSPGSSFEELARANLEAPAPFEPGATHHYSNLGYALLGELVARLRGDSWWGCVQSRILAPLAMTRTSYRAAEPAAQGLSVHPLAGTLSEEPAEDTRAMAPAGQLWSTVEDLARYASFLGTGHRWVLAADTVEEMATPHAGTLATKLASGYGLGLRLLPGGSGVLVGHTGSMPGFQASVFVDRGRRTGAVVLANSTAGLRPEQLAGDLLEELESCEPTVPPAWTPAASVPPEMAELLGVWHWGNTPHLLTWEDGRLVLTRMVGSRDRDTFRVRTGGELVGTSGYHHGETLHVVRDDDGRPHHLECATFIYTRTPYDPRAPIPGGPPR